MGGPELSAIIVAAAVVAYIVYLIYKAGED